VGKKKKVKEAKIPRIWLNQGNPEILPKKKALPT